MIRYIAVPGIALMLLATCCNLCLTKRKIKSRTDRLMEAVTENEPVIEAIIARGYASHEVHVCVRKFYTKNPSFVPLTEEKLLEMVKARKKQEKAMHQVHSKRWSAGATLGKSPSQGGLCGLVAAAKSKELSRSRKSSRSAGSKEAWPSP